MKSPLRIILYTVAGAAIVAAITFAVTMKLMRSGSLGYVEVPLEEYNRLEQTASFNELMDEIQARYYGEAPTREELLRAAFDGMLASLNDPYAKYFSQEEYEAYLKKFDGEYVGLGLLVSQVDQKGSKVLDVYDDTPAAKAGVKSGDVITKINGSPVLGLSLEELVRMLSGEEGTSIALTLLRENKENSLEVPLEKINVKHVHSSLFREYTGYIRIDMFSGNCAEEFHEALRNLTERKMRSLVLDVRNNPGGNLDTVVSIAETLIGQGKIVTIVDAAGEEAVYNGAGSGVGVPMAILVNGNSASASELLAAAVKENEKGVVVGTATYGKGVVQSTFRLNTSLDWVKLTTAAYFTPNGNSIQGTGVMPDIEIDLSDSYVGVPIDRINQEDDAQLWAALDHVRELADDLEREKLEEAA